MQPICPRSFHVVTWVGGSRQNVMRKRLVLSLCIVKQSYYIMWLICFINIRRMFQFPQLIASPFFYYWVIVGKISEQRRKLILSISRYFLTSPENGEWISKNFSVVWSKDFFYFEMFLVRKICTKGLCFGFFVSVWMTFRLFFHKSNFLTPLTLLNLNANTWILYTRRSRAFTSEWDKPNYSQKLLIFPEVRF